MVGATHAKQVHELADACGAESILDYGCGKCTLKRALDDLGLNLPAWTNYDPCIEEHSADPPESDLVVCTDVMEHVERECLGDVIAHLHSKTRKAIFLAIHIGPAVKTLPDGRNAHITQEPPLWWLEKFADKFAYDGFMYSGNTLLVMGRPKQ